MIVIKKGRDTIELYASIREAPIRRYITYNNHLVTDIGVGSSMDDVMSHLSRLGQLLQAEKNREAKQEAQNLQMNFFLMLERVNTQCLTFATLVSKVNRTSCFDMSDEGLKRTISLVDKTGLTISDIENELEKVKKKSSQN